MDVAREPQHTVTITESTGHLSPQQAVADGVMFDMTGLRIESIETFPSANVQAAQVVLGDTPDIVTRQPIGGCIGRKSRAHRCGMVNASQATGGRSDP